jgi:glutathione S-transferase
MNATYRLFGAETSAYSTKMRSYLRYKGVSFDWLPRNQDNEEELQKHSRFGTLPVLVTASGFAVHDTTPMMEALEADTPEPSALPADPALGFLAFVLEEYADSWLSKIGYHYRWTRKKDQRLAAQRVIEDYYTREAPEDRKALEDVAIERMLVQLKSVGVEGELGGALEKSFKRFVKLLDDHLRKHLFLFGGRPSIADFAIAGQLVQMMKDPTPAKIIEKEGEFVAKWCEFLEDPKPSGPYASLEDLQETLAPIFASELAAAFLPWAAENLESSLAGAPSFEIALGKESFTLAPMRSSARSFRELRRRFVTAQAIEALKAFTDAAGATVYLLRPQQAPRPQPVETPAAEETGEEAAAGEAAPSVEGEGAEGTGRRRRRRRRRRGGGADAAAGEAHGEADEDAEAEDGSGGSEDVVEASTAEASEGDAGEAQAASDDADDVTASDDDAAGPDGDPVRES